MPVAITIATIGVVCGIVFGIVMVNIGIRKGLIKHTTASLDDLPEEFRTGYIALGKRPPLEAQCPNPHRWTRLPFSWPLWVLLSPVPFGSEIFNQH